MLKRFDFLKEHPDLTVSERKALAFVIAEVEQVPFMSVQQVAEQAFVSKTVVINLTQKLNFSGFREFKYYLNQELQKEKKEIKQEEKDYKKNLTVSIEKTLSLISSKSISAASRLIINSRNVFVVARGTSKAVGYYVEHLLLSLGVQCIFIKDYNLLEMIPSIVQSSDVVILISLSGETDKIIQSAKKIKLTAATIISMTSFQVNSLEELSDLRLYCHAELVDTKTDDVTSRIGLLLLADVLINHVQQLQKQKVLKNKKPTSFKLVLSLT